MSKNLDLILDECIDRINSGESIEDCLAHYPEHAMELEPLLMALQNAGNICSDMPGAEARSMMRHKLHAAAIDLDKGTRTRRRQRISMLFGWSKSWAAVSVVLMLVVVGFGLHWILTPDTEQTNFRLLLSDAPNDIGDFSSLEVTISYIGVLRAGEDGGWEKINLEPAVVIDLTRLQGLNAQEVWKGILPEGQYREVYIYVENPVGTLTDGTKATVALPDGTMQISKPFAVNADDPVINFVYDLTVIATGSNYSLLPQLEESGATQRFYELGSGELTVQVIDGKVAPGETITIRVTSGTAPVSGALVTVNGKNMGTTNEIGIKAFVVPSNEELEIQVAKDQLHGGLDIDLESESNEQEGGNSEFVLEVLSGDVLPGYRITLLVTVQDNPVAGALVVINDSEIGTTGLDGKISFVVADEGEGLDIKAVKGMMEGDLEIELSEQLD